MIHVRIYKAVAGVWQDMTDDVKYPINTLTTLDESLDGGMVYSMPIESDIPLEPFSKIKLEFWDNEDTARRTYYYYASDSVEQFRSCKPILYTHNISLIEPTKILEKYFISGMSVTQPKDRQIVTTYKCNRCGALFDNAIPSVGCTTCYNSDRSNFTEGEREKNVKKVSAVIDTLLASNPLRTALEKECLFKLNDKLRDKLGSIISCEFKWSSRMSIMECLCEIGKFIGAMPRLIPNKDNDTVYDTITFDFYGSTGKRIERIEAEARRRETDVENYCSSLETIAENLISQNDEGQSSIVYPAPNAYITPRTTQDIRLTTDNCELVLPYPIYKIISVKLKSIICQVPYGANAETTVVIKGVDLTKIIVEENEYITLPEITGQIPGGSKTKNNTFSYRENSNILSLADRKYKYGWTNMIGVLDQAVKSLYRLDGKYDEYAEFTGYLANGEALICKKMINEAKLETLNDLRELEFQVEYIPFCKMKLNSVKDDMQTTTSSIAYNQFAEINDTRNMGRNMRGTCNGIGTENESLLVRLERVDELPYVGDIVNGKIVTAIDTEFASTAYLKATLNLSSQFNRINEYVGINRKYRQWKIPADGIERDLHYDEFCEISREELPLTTRLMSIESRAILKNTFEENKYNGITEVNCAEWEQYPYDDNPKILFSTNSQAFGNSLAFSFVAQDNYSAGVNANCVDVAYAKNGVAERVKIGFGCELYDGYSPKDLPLLPSSRVSSATGVKTIMYNDFVVNKDEAEKICFTFQLHFVPKESSIVVGTALAENCPLIREYKKNKLVVVRALRKRITKYELLLDRSFCYDGNLELASTMTADGQIRLEVKNLPREAIGWVITDGRDNIMLAQNENSSVVFLNFVGSRS